MMKKQQAKTYAKRNAKRIKNEKSIEYKVSKAARKGRKHGGSCRHGCSQMPFPLKWYIISKTRDTCVVKKTIVFWRGKIDRLFLSPDMPTTQLFFSLSLWTPSQIIFVDIFLNLLDFVRLYNSNWRQQLLGEELALLGQEPRMVHDERCLQCLEAWWNSSNTSRHREQLVYLH